MYSFTFLDVSLMLALSSIQSGYSDMVHVRLHACY